MAVNYFARSPFDDLDDDENALENVQYIFHPTNQDRQQLSPEMNCQEMIIAFDAASTILLQGYLSNTKVENVGYLALEGQTSQRHQYQIVGVNSDSSVLVCFCSNKPLNSFRWAQKLLQVFNANKMIFLTSSHQCNYQSMQRMDLPFLRTLRTGSWTEHDSITTLEQPNIITDTPAAVITECQIKGKPAILYICYTESSVVDMQALKLLCGCLTGSLLQQSTNISWEVLRSNCKKAIHLKLSSNTLYM